MQMTIALTHIGMIMGNDNEQFSDSSCLLDAQLCVSTNFFRLSDFQTFRQIINK